MTNKRVQEYIQSLKSINLEITSLCNMSKEHCTQCPNAWRAQKFGNTKIKTPLIEQFFKDLASNQYTGLTAFHSYNEPLMDKRIFDIIEMHKKICGAARVMVLSNGRLLTQKKADRLMELKVDKITISAYEYSTFKRMEEMFDKLKIDNPDCESIFQNPTLLKQT